MERWKQIKQYPEYLISDYGRVWHTSTIVHRSTSNYRLKGHFIRQHMNKKGYYRVDLCKNGHKRTFRTNRLVAKYFVPNPHNRPCVNHINEHKWDNYYKNLEWCDYKYNDLYGTRLARINKKETNPVTLIRGNIKKHFQSTYRAAIWFHNNTPTKANVHSIQSTLEHTRKYYPKSTYFGWKMKNTH